MKYLFTMFDRDTLNRDTLLKRARAKNPVINYSDILRALMQEEVDNPKIWENVQVENIAGEQETTPHLARAV